MNKCILTLVFLIVTFNAYSQGMPYYWSGNKKINLTVDSTTFILSTQTISGSESILGNISHIKHTKTLRSGFVLVELDQKTNQINQLKNNKLIKNISYSYFNSLNRKVIPTGEILLHPKEGNSIASVISKFPSVLSIQNASDYGDFVLRVENNANILEVANMIYESGVVEYAIQIL